MLQFPNWFPLIWGARHHPHSPGFLTRTPTYTHTRAPYNSGRPSVQTSQYFTMLFVVYVIGPIGANLDLVKTTDILAISNTGCYSRCGLLPAVCTPAHLDNGKLGTERERERDSESRGLVNLTRDTLLHLLSGSLSDVGWSRCSIWSRY